MVNFRMIGANFLLFCFISFFSATSCVISLLLVVFCIFIFAPERHYFRDRLLRSYDFTFPFCIPGSTNTWESVYDLPELSEADSTNASLFSLHRIAMTPGCVCVCLAVQDMIANPGAVKSDSFYFVGDDLIMQNKASYTYDPRLKPE